MPRNILTDATPGIIIDVSRIVGESKIGEGSWLQPNVPIQ
jgi:hypothetical protein